MSDVDIRTASLEYHRHPTPGKIAVTPTKQLTNQRDLALAYTPGVAAACDEIVRDPAEARNLTARGTCWRGCGGETRLIKCATGSGGPSKGIFRIVACVSVLICASQAADPHQRASTNPGRPSSVCLSAS